MVSVDGVDGVDGAQPGEGACGVGEEDLGFKVRRLRVQVGRDVERRRRRRVEEDGDGVGVALGGVGGACQ